MPKQAKKPRGFDAAIPAAVGDRFIGELKQLLDELANEGGFKEQYQRDECFSKYCDQTTTSPTVRRDRAIKKWLDTEARNARTTSRIMFGLAFEQDFGWATWEQIRTCARELIERVLGPVVYPDVIQSGVYTNGASTRVRKSPSAALFKLAGEGHISTSAIKHWLAAFSGTLMSSQTLSLMESSMLFTVPKTSEIDRAAAKEPECDMILQRSVGIHIRQRLKVFGIDLKDQTRNQELARTAVTKGLATVDLSSASDSITTQLVLELLPLEWFSLLDDLRVKSVILDAGQKTECLHTLSMFSSMGNGFTFELESLLFYALTRAVCELSDNRGRVSVYGDDIICPSAVIPRLRNVFGFLGLLMNPKKTHDTGLFRESCGSHWWNGVDVKPFYVREAVRDLPQLVNHLNHLLEWNGRGWGFFTSEVAYQFWKRWIEYVPEKIWGGIDPADPSALVTGHSPRNRVVLKSRRSKRPSRQAEILWHLYRDRHQTVPKSIIDEHLILDVTNDKGEVVVGEEAHLVIDPRVVVGFKLLPFVSRGERTSWSPGIPWELG